MRIRAQGNPIFIIGHGFAVYLTRDVEAVSVKPPLTHTFQTVWLGMCQKIREPL